MPSLFTELRRRNVFKVGAAYAIVAWLLIEVSSVLLPTFNAPEWIMQVFTLFVLLGLPVALLLAWAFDLTPQGIKAASDIHSHGAPAQMGGQRLSYVFQGLVFLAVGFLVVDQYVLMPGASVAGNRAAIEAIPTTFQPSLPVRRFTIDLGSTEPMGNTLLSAQIALSRDGTRLVYAVREDGQQQLYLRNLDELDSVSMPDTQGAAHPAFSPDGLSVVYFSDETDQRLKRVSVRGGQSQELAESPTASGSVWEADDTIIFATQDEFGVRGMYRISASGGPPELLTIPDADEGHVWPEVLPGGRAVVFAVRPGGGAGGGAGGSGNASDGRIDMLVFETGEVRTLIEGGFRPRYVPTGHIAFVRSGSLWVVPFDLQPLEKTGAEIRVLQGVQQDGFIGDSPYAFSDDGMLLYVPGGDTNVTGANDRRLVWVDRQGREEPIPAEPRPYFNPRLSPDDQRLTITILGQGDPGDVWTFDLTRARANRLTFSSSFDSWPVWTPDGNRIIFYSTRDGGGLFWRAADGSGQAMQLTSSSILQVPSEVSPDGTQLVFQNAQPPDLHVLLLDGDGTSRLLFETPFNESYAAFSPDGRLIAYQSNETGQAEIYVRDFPVTTEGGKWQISTNGGQEPRWGSTSEELFYRGEGAVMSVSIDTEPRFLAGNPSVLFRGAYDSSGGGNRSYDVSDNGQRFVMMKQARLEQGASEETQLIVVDNWFEELNRLTPPSP